MLILTDIETVKDGKAVEIVPQQGLGQSYLRTKAAFHWQAGRWAGLITRLQSAQSSTSKTHFDFDERIHMAQLVVVPAANASWGYGIYVHPDVSGDLLKKTVSRFTALKTTGPLFLRTPDLSGKYEFATPSDDAIQTMKKALAAEP